MTFTHVTYGVFKAQFRYHMLLTHVKLTQPQLLESFKKAHKQKPAEAEAVIEQARERMWKGDIVKTVTRLLKMWGRSSNGKDRK